MPKQTQISCRTACAGQASGRPVIVNGPADLDKVGIGDILVSTETEVLYVPAMHRAAAIVTERGGRFCHAAIWARENGKPTLLGATGATQLLAGVDHVHVDADEGILSWEE